jgi:hypothetical protein
MNDKLPDDQINLLLLLATFKSFTEQLHNIKGIHSQLVKKRFNMLMSATKSYERTLDVGWLKTNQDVIEQLSDSLTDYVYIIRENVEGETKKQLKQKTK